MTLVVALILFGAGGVCRGEGALTDTIGNPASAASKNPPATQFARMRNANRIRELIMSSDDFRTILVEWDRPWIIDKPSHMPYWRIHGGLE
jgi:hypothetical protein